MSTFSTDDWDDRVKQNFQYLRQIVRKGNKVLKASPSIDGYRLPDDWQWPELSLDKAEHKSEELSIPLKKEKENNIMSNKIEVGDIAKFVGVVKEIQYNSAGVPSGYVVVDETTGIGSPIPAVVTDKVDIHPKLPESIGKIIHNLYGVMCSMNKDYVTLDTEGVSYVNFLVDLINVIDDDTDYNWIKDNESDLYNAYTYGYTVAKPDFYLYPVPNTKNHLFYHKGGAGEQITTGSELSVSDFDTKWLESGYDEGYSQPFLFTKDELETLNVSLSDALVWEG